MPVQFCTHVLILINVVNWIVGNMQLADLGKLVKEMDTHTPQLNITSFLNVMTSNGVFGSSLKYNFPGKELRMKRNAAFTLLSVESWLDLD